MTKSAFLGAMLYVSYTLFSHILYLEVISLLIVVFALYLPRKVSSLATLVFTLLILLFNGLTPWNFGYLIIYNLDNYLINKFRNVFINHHLRIVLLGAIVSFSTGMLLDLSFMIFSSKLSLIVIVLGLKTSIIQAALAAIQVNYLHNSLAKVLIKVGG